MTFFKKIALAGVAIFSMISTAYAENFNIKYSSNYLMPAYVSFKHDSGKYEIQSKINVPLYNIVFTAKGTEKNGIFNMLSYRDTRNGKTYALAEIDSKNIQYGKAKEPLKTEPLTMPTFDLFTTAFQLSYYDKLPTSFQTTNGKKLYPTPNVNLNKTQKAITQMVKLIKKLPIASQPQITKAITVKKFEGEKFPRFISYNRDGDNYELKFDSFVK